MKKLTKTQIKKLNNLEYSFRYNDDNNKLLISDVTGYKTIAKKDLEKIKEKISCKDIDILTEYIISIADHFSPKSDKEAAQAAKQEAKQSEIELCKNYSNTYDYNLNLNCNLDLLKMSIRLELQQKNISKNLINDTITSIISKIKLLKAAKQYEKYSKLGYIYDDEGKIDQNAPVNYDIFYENHFADKDKWQEADDNERKNLNYVFYDTWKDSCKIWNKNKYDIVNMGNIRNIVRSYAPVSNKDIINDGFIEWVKNNRETNILKEYFESLFGKWDGIDRLGLFDESKDNIFLEVWDADQTILNKHELNYILIHAFRQTLEPCKYNYQHMLVLHGRSDNGKTKVLRDLFTFDIPGFETKQNEYFCEDINIEANNWTIAPLMNSNLALIFGERNGIDKANNNTIKKWVDKLNSTIQYQRKGENEIRETSSHCVAFITTNDNKLLNDFTLGGYDKRFHIIHIKGTNARFVNKYVNVIKENRIQIWAEIAEWYIKNNDKYDLLDLTAEDKKNLDIIQTEYRTITDEDVLPILDDILNKTSYGCSTISVMDKFRTEGNVNLNIVYLTAIKAYCKQKYGWQQRHWEYIGTNNYELLSKIGFKYVRKTLESSRIQCLERINYDDVTFITEQDMPF